jgi:hypothetical protein
VKVGTTGTTAPRNAERTDTIATPIRGPWGIVAAPMSNILSRLAAVGIVAGGFALTGDLGKLAQRGIDVVNSRDVPWPRATHAEATPSPADDGAQSASETTASPEPAAGAVASGAAAPGPTRPLGVVRDTEFRPPRDGLDQIDPSSLEAGGRIVVWLSMPRRSGGRAYRCLVFDVVDPSSGEALAYEAVSFTGDGVPQATATPPHRVRLVGHGPSGTIVRGGEIDVQRRGIAADGVGGECIGPIAALDLVL